MEYFLIYLFVMCESIAGLFAAMGGLLVIGLVCTGILILAGGINAIDYEFSDVWDNKHIVKIRKCLMLFIIFGAIGVCVSRLIPTQKDLAIIIGAGVTYQAVTSETGKRIGGKAVDLLEQKIDDALKSKAEDKPKEQPKVEGKST